MPEHMGHPYKAEAKLQEIGEGPTVEIERLVETIFDAAADGEIDQREQIQILVSAGRIGTRNARVRMKAMEGGAKVTAIEA